MEIFQKTRIPGEKNIFNNAAPKKRGLFGRLFIQRIDTNTNQGKRRFSSEQESVEQI
jgi:hypothetical protein